MKIALQQKLSSPEIQGQFMHAENGGDNNGRVFFDRTEIGAHETFTVWHLGDGYVAFETEKHRFLTRIPLGHVGAGTWEASRARKNDVNAALGLRNVPNDVVSLDHQAWEAHKWSELQRDFMITVVEGGASAARALDIDGPWFIDKASRQRAFLLGTDQFVAYERFRAGADLSALYRESQDLGFWIWRVFTMATWTVHPDEDDLSQIGPFVDELNAHGITPQLEVLADCQVLLPSWLHQQRRWQAICDRVRGKSVLVSGGNEWDKNGFDPIDLQEPGPDVIWSRGSATGDKVPYLPPGLYHCFHPRRDYPKMLDDSVASATFLAAHGYTRPLVMDEGIGFASYTQDGRRSNDPELARRLAGHYALEWAGAYFHNEPGMSCILMDDVTRRCAEAWTGMILRVTGQLTI